MKAQELRIENLVDRDGKLYRILSGYGLLTGAVAKYKPIPITPEILEKCEFERYLEIAEHKKIDILEGYVNIKFMFNTFPLVLDIDCNRMPLDKVKYLHQLQNLYFALTGEELEFKP